MVKKKQHLVSCLVLVIKHQATCVENYTKKTKKELERTRISVSNIPLYTFSSCVVCPDPLITTYFISQCNVIIYYIYTILCIYTKRLWTHDLHTHMCAFRKLGSIKCLCML